MLRGKNEGKTNGEKEDKGIEGKEGGDWERRGMENERQ